MEMEYSFIVKHGVIIPDNMPFRKFQMYLDLLQKDQIEGARKPPT